MLVKVTSHLSNAIFQKFSRALTKLGVNKKENIIIIKKKTGLLGGKAEVMAGKIFMRVGEVYDVKVG